MIRVYAITLLATLVTTGCFKTHYVSLYPSTYEPPRNARRDPADPASWHNFWLYGWVPGKVKVNSLAICGEGYVREIHTERTFLQGVVASLTTLYYVNIYSPWYGETECEEQKPPMPGPKPKRVEAEEDWLVPRL